MDKGTIVPSAVGPRGTFRTSGRSLNTIVLAVCIATGVVVGTGSSIVIAKWQAERTVAAQTSHLGRQLFEVQKQADPSAHAPVAISSAPFGSASIAQLPAEQAPGPKAILPEPRKDGIVKRAGRLAELRMYDDAKIQQHWESPVDKSWSDVAAPSLRSDLEQLAKSNKFSLVNVDCRSVSCVATFEWPTYDDALAEFASIVRGSFDVNCSRGMTLPENSSSAHPVVATAFFDCGQWKHRGSHFAKGDGRAR